MINITRNNQPYLQLKVILILLMKVTCRSLVPWFSNGPIPKLFRILGLLLYMTPLISQDVIDEYADGATLFTGTEVEFLNWSI